MPSAGGPAPKEKRRSVATSRTPRSGQSLAMSGAIRAVCSAGRSRPAGMARGCPRARRMSWWWMSVSTRPGSAAQRGGLAAGLQIAGEQS